MLKVEVTDTGGPAAMAKMMAAAAQAAAESTAATWHSDLMPRHFEPQAMGRYAYMPRLGQEQPANIPSNRNGVILRHGKNVRVIKNPAYYWWKQRAGFGTTALVKTGRTRQAVESVMKIKSKIVRKDNEVQAIDVLAVPSYFWKYRQRHEGGFVDKVAELTSVLPVEEVELGKFMAATATNELQKRSASVTTTETL